MTIKPICAICDKPAPDAVAVEGLDAVCRSCMKPVSLQDGLLNNDAARLSIAHGRLTDAKNRYRIAKNRRNFSAMVSAEFSMQLSEIDITALENKMARESRVKCEAAPKECTRPQMSFHDVLALDSLYNDHMQDARDMDLARVGVC